MNLTHIEHIGIAVENMENAIAYYENILGLKCYKIEEVADQKVKTAFFQIGQTSSNPPHPMALSLNLSKKKDPEFITSLLHPLDCKNVWMISLKKEFH